MRRIYLYFCIICLATILTACSSQKEVGSSGDVLLGEEIEIANSDDVQDAKDNKKANNNDKYSLTKGRDEITFKDLDENEQAVVGFIEIFYNVDMKETEEEFKQRVTDYYDPGEKMCTRDREIAKKEFDCFLYAAGDVEYLPEFGPRKLKEVHLLPEYFSRDDADYHVIITLITYESNGEEVFEEVQFDVKDSARYNIEGIEGRKIGILDNYDWYVKEIVKKYDDIYGEYSM